MNQIRSGASGVALVTGSSRGIGRGIALALARRGFDVAIHGRSNRTIAEETAAEAATYGVRTHVVIQDVAEIATHESIVKDVEAALGPITCFVNNAGVGALRREDVLQAQEDSYDHCMLINAKAAFFFTQAVARRMALQPAEGCFRSMMMISSVSAHSASINRGEYCVSKSAAAMVASVFAARMAEFGVAVFDIRPGVIETDMSRQALGAYQQRIDKEKLTLIPRIGQPDDVGRTVAALACGDLPYATGQVLNIDGGMSVQTL